MNTTPPVSSHINPVAQRQPTGTEQKTSGLHFLTMQGMRILDSGKKHVGTGNLVRLLPSGNVCIMTVSSIFAKQRESYTLEFRHGWSLSFVGDNLSNRRPVVFIPLQECEWKLVN